MNFLLTKTGETIKSINVPVFTCGKLKLVSSYPCLSIIKNNKLSYNELTELARNVWNMKIFAIGAHIRRYPTVHQVMEIKHYAIKVK